MAWGFSQPSRKIIRCSRTSASSNPTVRAMNWARQTRTDSTRVAMAWIRWIPSTTPSVWGPCPGAAGGFSRMWGS